MHLDEELLQRLLHQQLAPGVGRVAREHLAECTECRERFVNLERDEARIFALLRQVDHPPPAVDAETVAARARRSGLVWGRRAAGILLLLGMAGAAYAIPGSPVRDWVQVAAEWIRGSDRTPAEPNQVKTPEPQGAGIAAVPGRRFMIAFQSSEPGGQARVALTDGDEVTVRAPQGAATFTSAADLLVIENVGSGVIYEIQIPRTAPRVEIRVAGERIFLKDGSRIVTSAVEGIGGYYTMPLSSLSRLPTPDS